MIRFVTAIFALTVSSFILADEKSKDALKRQYTDPGYVESSWKGDTFLLAIKVPPNPKVYLPMMCKQAATTYKLSNFKIELRKIGRSDLIARINCK